MIKQIEIIGEAANFLSDDLRQHYKHVEWSKIIGARNIYVHEYFQVNWLLVWEIIKGDIPELEMHINEILTDLK